MSCCCWGGPWNHNASQPTCLSAHCSTTAAVASIAAVCHRCLPALLCLVLSADGPDSVRLLDEQTFEVLDRLQLQPHELACSLCRQVPLAAAAALQAADAVGTLHCSCLIPCLFVLKNR